MSTKKPEHPTPPPKPVPGAKVRAEKAALDKELDEALEETFPASDSLAVDPPSKKS
jgi:hypothetical protein